MDYPYIDTLQKRLGYQFKDITLLKRALTHSSLSNQKNNVRDLERLEFLGDRVLGLLTAEALWRRFPDFAEGEMAPRLNAMVRKETCAKAAKAIGLAEAIIMSPSEEEAGGREKDAILGDSCEALLGALYVDGGLKAARIVYEMYWLKHFDKLAARYKDSKTTLQEWAQSKGKEPPTYDVVSTSGPAHSPVFKIVVMIDGVKPQEASGSSKRAAQSLAAQKLLLREGIWTQDDID
jgi:ribonuclease-3